jgi:hypothetical protein
MSSSNQEIIPSLYIQPIHADSFDDDDEPSPICVSMSIFRNQEGGAMSPPTVYRANPICAMEEDERESYDCHYDTSPYMISPYPLSPCQEEIENRSQLSRELDFAWQDKPMVDFIDYSFYFEPLPDQMEDASFCDDASFDDFQIHNATNFWDEGVAHVCNITHDTCVHEKFRSSSPAQVSVGTEFGNDGASQ